MTRKLVKTGNSIALVVDKTMKEHLGVTDEVEVIYAQDRIVLKRPMTVTRRLKDNPKRFMSSPMIPI